MARTDRIFEAKDAGQRIGFGGAGLDKKRDYGIESLRWVAMLAVVMHHGISHQRLSASTIDQILILKEWIEWCVPAFFYVSGRLFRKSSPSEFPSQFALRARRLLVPYFIASVFSFAILWSLHQTGAWRHSKPEELLFGDLLHRLVWLVGFGPQMYFLPYLLLVGLLSGLLAFAFPPKWLSTVSFTTFLVCGFGWLMPETVLGAGLERLPAFLFSFCLGISDNALKGSASRVHLAATVVGLALVAFLIQDYWPLSIGAPLLLYRLLSRIRTQSVIRRLDRFGSPGSVFLWHAPLVLPACSTLLGILGVINWGNYLLSVILATCASILIGRVVARIPGLRLANL